MGKIIEPDGSWLIGLMLNFPATAAALNNNLGGCQLSQEGNDFYIVGADSVRKKLGSCTVRGACKLVANNNSASATVIDDYLVVSGFKKITYSVDWKVGTGSVTAKINSVTGGNSVGSKYSYNLTGSDSITFSIPNSGGLSARVSYTLE